MGRRRLVRTGALCVGEKVVFADVIWRPEDWSPELILGRLMKQVNRKGEVPLTLYLKHYPAGHEMSPAPAMVARAALGCRHPPVEREWTLPPKVYQSPSHHRAS